jgi:hypothetical protein
VVDGTKLEFSAYKLPEETTMSDELHLQDHSQYRYLRDEEKYLLSFLLSKRKDFPLIEQQIAHGRVRDLCDGGMKSVEFWSPEKRSFGATLLKAEYLDEDGVPLSIAINADSQGLLYEVDLWKVDFSPLKLYPQPEFVKIISSKPF